MDADANIHAPAAPLVRRPERVADLTDVELEQELTKAASARTHERRDLFDLLLVELDRRRSAA
jgi:hypothetical protein